ncbi:hypothetical protein HPB49_010360 [Dermacentor silvarum]|uniref:Uncharacterized protein n=1 Tax=Dermacentor silvarum TaxID=543639 RepID=A0ACB8DCB0_DERSI|nr:hypothetical protein HPB49_010360 [Dermacentor silvarum]
MRWNQWQINNGSTVSAHPGSSSLKKQNKSGGPQTKTGSLQAKESKDPQAAGRTNKNQPSDDAELVDHAEDLDNPMEAALAISLGQQTVVVDDRKALVMVPGKGKTPVSIVYGEHAEELAFAQIYFGESRKIKPDCKPSVYAMAPLCTFVQLETENSLGMRSVTTLRS